MLLAVFLIVILLLLLLLLVRKLRNLQALYEVTADADKQSRLPYSADYNVLYDQALFKTLYDKAPIGMGVATPDGRIFMVNPRFLEILGFTGDQIIGKTFLDLTYTDDIDITRQGFERICQKRATSYQMEKRYVHHDGHVVWVQVNAVMVCDNGGNPVCIIGQVLDISMARKHQQQLQQWEDIFHHTDFGVILNYAENSQLDLVNPAFAAMHGYTPDELAGLPVMNLVPQSEHQRIQDFIRLADDVGHCTYESFARHCDGSVFPILVSITVVYHPHGPVRYRIGSIVDIRQRRATEDAVRASESRLKEAERLAHMGSWEWNITTGDQIWSDETYRIFGLSPETPAGYDQFIQLLQESDKERVQIGYQEAIKNNTPYHIEFDVHRKDGSIRRIVSHSQIYFDTDHKPVRAIGTNLDITEIHNAEQKLCDTQARFQGLAENIPGVVFQAFSADDGSTFSFLYMNENSERLFGHNAVSYIGNVQLFLMSVHLLDRASFDQSRRYSAVENKLWNWDGRVVLADKKEIWINLRAMPRRQEKILLWDGVMLNITSSKQAESDLYLSRQLVRELAAEMEMLREHERKHVAREIHDELGQLLTALRMEVSLLRIRYGDKNEPLRDSLKGMTSLVDQAIAAVRAVVTDLRPAVLDMGLSAAVEWLLTEFSSRSGIPCQFNILPGNIEVEEHRAVAVFRIVQESLTNISRYAQATRVSVDVSFQGNQLLITIRDDGKGFNPQQKSERKSYGLLGMQERALSLGGTLVINSGPGNGTDIILQVPMADNRMIYDSYNDC